MYSPMTVSLYQSESRDQIQNHSGAILKYNGHLYQKNSLTLSFEEKMNYPKMKVDRLCSVEKPKS
jgi:hypothetical protein